MTVTHPLDSASSLPPLPTDELTTTGPEAPAVAASEVTSALEAPRERIRSIAAAVAAELPPNWQLDRFVATNPLAAFEDRPVEVALVDAAQRLGVRTEFDESTYRAWYAGGKVGLENLRAAAHDHLIAASGAADEDDVVVLVSDLLTAPAQPAPGSQPVLLTEWHDLDTGAGLAAAVDDYCAWWLASYLGDHPAWALPDRDRGLYVAWRQLAGHDVRLRRMAPSAHPSLVSELPERADDAVLEALRDLAVDRRDHAAYLLRHLTRSLGWSMSLVRARGTDSEDIVGYLALRLAVERLLLSNGTTRAQARRAAAAPQAAVSGSPERLAIWRDAFERSVADPLIRSLRPQSDATPSHRPASNVVLCIDPRSEGLRRHLEAIGDHATIGFAGFFGLAVDIVDLDADQPAASCPVIVPPQASFVERSHDGGAERRERGLARLQSAVDVFATTKRSTAAPFALAEAAGWWCGPRMALRTVLPRLSGSWTRAGRRWIAPSITSHLEPVADRSWSLDERVSVAASILRTTGLMRNPARLVLLCGHRSGHVNNLHRASLDCGACGGRGGGNNARIAAALLNDPVVRSGLAERGLPVPTDTWFVAGEHDTTTDIVTVFDRHVMPATHTRDLVRLETDLAEAGDRLAEERAATLPAGVGRFVTAGAAAVRSRRDDWAQVVAEWGLAGNAALVVGPRTLTQGLDLQRRVFLHTYEPDLDPDGAVLGAILGGPLVVAHWINSQYRMSTIDPERLGAGTKPAHNLIPGVGVIEGSAGDVRVGLPLESVSLAGREAHDAVRLVVVIDTTEGAVDAALAADPTACRLVEHGWIRLLARSADEPGAWAERMRSGAWRPWNATTNITEGSEHRGPLVTTGTGH